MLPEALLALATAGGTAVVQAAGTEAWEGFRGRLAGWFGRGDSDRERGELVRLDRSASELAAAGPDGDTGAERARIRQEAMWQARFEGLLENLPDDERERAAEELRALLDTHAAPGVSAGDSGFAVGGDVHVRADHGSIAAAVIHGGAHLSPPPPPAPSQG
ncbi:MULTISPECIES: hypothetical protein [unclassified Streptomyces]|uniref:hypothetical protein n=1 Tax=unclassified Streptomyces TaxID=2593676 RepID=UPI00225BBA68|nr:MULTISPECIES: hypothetical protein [unclassified Streptomyces]MCX4527419.1 hypothetical protein [Streptomyces sp. NBC_01551]MCX4542000.1 hypothetical protein [Streptomyces sp. NBC_01565]